MSPFRYPDSHHELRHGPRGYGHLGSFRPWLRDEYSFRCVYCLVREQWGRVRGAFDLDHFVPQSKVPALGLVYENLLYSCRTCNAAKQAIEVPDPCQALLAQSVQIHPDGRIEGLTADARRLIRVLGLDDSEYTEFRELWLRIIELAHRHNHDLYVRLMGFPDDLPDLSRLRPPGGNARPTGIENCHFVQRKRGELAEAY